MQLHLLEVRRNFGHDPDDLVICRADAHLVLYFFLQLIFCILGSCSYLELALIDHDAFGLDDFREFDEARFAESLEVAV